MLQIQTVKFWLVGSKDENLNETQILYLVQKFDTDCLFLFLAIFLEYFHKILFIFSKTSQFVKCYMKAWFAQFSSFETVK